MSYSVTRARAIRVCLLLVCSMVFIGCASPTDHKAGSAKAAVLDFTKSLDRMEAAVDTSIRTLDRLASAKTFSTDQAYLDFLSDYFNVSGDAAQVGQRAEVMRDAGVDYFVTAGDSPDDRAKAKRVQDVVRPKYDTVEQSLSAGRTAYKAYQTELGNLAKFLSKDQSPERIAAAGNLITSARQKGTELKAAIRLVRSDANQMALAAKAAAEN